MLFVLIYIPCLATLATIYNETKSWKWTLFSVVYSLILAWLVSFVFYQTMVHNIWQEVLVGLVIIFAIFVLIKKIVSNWKKKNNNNCSGCIGGNMCNSCPVKNE